MKKLVACLLICFLSLTAPAWGNTTATPRVVIGLYNGKNEPSIIFSWFHKMAEMPLNHLGLILEYHDVNEALPDLSTRDDVIGVMTWFTQNNVFDDPNRYIKWAVEVIDQGKKFVMLGYPGFFQNTEDEDVSLIEINHFLRRLGLKYTGKMVENTYSVETTLLTPNMLNFERKIKGFITQYPEIITVKNDTRPHLIAHKNHISAKESTLIATSPHGGYIATGYSAFYEVTSVSENKEREIRQWYVNPFLFFEEAFSLESTPKPDTTTLAGRRIYYSHIDGDGWNNLSTLEEHRNKDVLASDVIFEKVISPNPDLPVTVAPIAGDLDKEWLGIEKGQEIARAILALPQVEVASHTYSHPYHWAFFEDYTKEKERPFLSKYHYKTWGRREIWKNIKGLFSGDESDASYKTNLPDSYDTPRSYAFKPFETTLEIQGANNLIESFAPAGKKIRLIQWSGNTFPYEGFIKKTKEAGMYNINGGDTRFDREFPSYGWVSPIGRQVGKQRQIYSSLANETIYTDIWTSGYHRFKYLVDTIRNTEAPIRVKPINLYYHMYSGEKQASLNALLENIAYIKTQNIVPITTSHFSSIAEGFYTAEIHALGNQRWEIKNRGELQTFRLDNATYKTIDLIRSHGIIGMRHNNGSLYVYLDKTVATPIIAVKTHANLQNALHITGTYLVESRWPIWNMKKNGNTISFESGGFGEGQMKWKLQRKGYYKVTADSYTTTVKTDKNNVIDLAIPNKNNQPIKVLLTFLR